MMVSIRYVQDKDKSFWFKLDKHISEVEFEKKVRDKMGYILVENKIPIGLLRYNLFWDNTPFCTMLFIDWEYQYKGYRRTLMEFWEKDMESLGYGMVLTSTQADETAHYFYRKIGYHEAGKLCIDIPDYEQPIELFFIKMIG